MSSKTNQGLDITPLKGSRDEIKLLPSQKKYEMIGVGTTIFCGVSGSGKSNLVANLLSRKDMLKGFFKEIYLICPSASDIITNNVRELTKEKCYDDLAEGEGLLNFLYERNKYLGFRDAPNTLVIIDDAAHSQKFSKSDLIKKLAFSATHTKISIWFLTQSLRRVDNNMRINAHYIVLFHGTRESELLKLIKDLAGFPLPEKVMLDIIRDNIKEQYSFVVIANNNPDKSRNILVGFKGRIVLNCSYK